MKKILFILFLVSFSGCVSLSTTTLKGSVTAYNDDGTILQKWDNVIIGESTNYYGKHTDIIKPFGLNFYDNSANKYVILSNAVPYIITYDEYKTEKKETSYDINETAENDFSYNTNVFSNDKPTEKELGDYLEDLNKEYDSIRKQMKNLDKKSKEYEYLKTKRKNISDKKTEIKTLMWEVTDD